MRLLVGMGENTAVELGPLGFVLWLAAEIVVAVVVIAVAVIVWLVTAIVVVIGWMVDGRGGSMPPGEAPTEPLDRPSPH